MPTQPSIFPTYVPSIDCYDEQENINSRMKYVYFESHVKMDNWSVLYDETHWKLTGYTNNGEAETVYFYETSGFYNDLDIVVTTACLPVNKIGSDCFVFELSDDYGDGLSQTGDDDNYWIMILRENDYDFIYPWENEHYLWIKQGQFKSSKNRDAYYLSINFCLSDDDIGITASPSPSPTHIPTPLPTHRLCNQSYALFTLQIELDYWAVTYNETYWSLRKVHNYYFFDNINSTATATTTSDMVYIVKDYGASYSNQWKLNDTIVEYEICLPIASNDCYQFKITDTFGDGLDDAGSGQGDNIWLYLDSHLTDKKSWRNRQTMTSQFCMNDYYSFMPTPSPSIFHNQQAISSNNENNNNYSDLYINIFIVSFIATLSAVIVVGIVIGIVYMYRHTYNQKKKLKNANDTATRRKFVTKNVSIQSSGIDSVEMGAIDSKHIEEDSDDNTHIAAHEKTPAHIGHRGVHGEDVEEVDVQDIQPPIKVKKSQDGIGMYESIGL